MRPETNRDNQSQSHPVSVPLRDSAANVVRGQIDTIYENQAPTDQTMPAAPRPDAEQWKRYHSAWQDYYQKYYQRYYTTQVHHYLQQQATVAQPVAKSSAAPEPMQVTNLSGRDETLFELRRKLLANVEQSAKKVRKSRHFIPIAAALGVVLVFVFLQYNQVLFSNVQAYISPGAINPQNIIIDPTSDVTVSPEPLLIIPKINVNVPVVYGVANDQKSLLKAMEGGIVHFAVPGASSVPGQIGNTVLSGHSSNDLFEPGNYKFIFAQLDKLENGDTFYANYEGKRYTYVVTKKEVVMPSDVQALIYPTDKPIMTLITCTPLGTALKRLLVIAEQVSPDPTAASKPPEDKGDSKSGMPGTSPTVIERIFGGN